MLSSFRLHIIVAAALACAPFALGCQPEQSPDASSSDLALSGAGGGGGARPTCTLHVEKADQIFEPDTLHDSVQVFDATVPLTWNEAKQQLEATSHKFTAEVKFSATAYDVHLKNAENGTDATSRGLAIAGENSTISSGANLGGFTDLGPTKYSDPVSGPVPGAHKGVMYGAAVNCR